MECEAVGDVLPVCGMQNPEDLALLVDGRTLVVSQFGMMDGSRAGNMAFLDAETREHRVAWRGGDAASSSSDGETWGDPGCPGPPPSEFSPHGISLFTRPDGRVGLWVVNHGGRESVEGFELVGVGAEAEYRWRGCVVAPEPLYLNDVVALPEGGFLVTHMMSRDEPLWGVIKATLGVDTGSVYEWKPDGGFRELPGSAAPFPYGIELSEDGSTVYLNVYAGNEVRRIDRESGTLLGSAPVSRPDNSSWGRDGRLLVASHHGGLPDMIQCQDIDTGGCPMAFEIVALHPETLAAEVVYAGAGAPMGGGTVALDVGDSLVIGSFAGDRVIFAPKH